MFWEKTDKCKSDKFQLFGLIPCFRGGAFALNYEILAVIAFILHLFKLKKGIIISMFDMLVNIVIVFYGKCLQVLIELVLIFFIFY